MTMQHSLKTLHKVRTCFILEMHPITIHFLLKSVDVKKYITYAFLKLAKLYLKFLFKLIFKAYINFTRMRFHLVISGDFPILRSSIIVNRWSQMHKTPKLKYTKQKLALDYHHDLIL